MPINIQDYLLGRIPVGRKIDIPAYLMAKAASGGIQEITGTLPLTVRSYASQVLENYRIYGTESGVGVKTENLFNGKGTDNYGYYNNTNGLYVDDNQYKHWKFSVKSGDVIRWTTTGAGYGCYFLNGAYRGRFYNYNTPFTVPYAVDEITNNFHSTAWDSAMVTLNQPLPDHYIPYGYKLPLKVTKGGTTTDYPIYIGDSQLMEGEYVDYEEQKIYKLVDGVLTPTDPPVPFPDITIPKGEVTIDIEGNLKPKATVKGLIKRI